VDGHEALPGGEGGGQVRLFITAGVAATAVVAVAAPTVVHAVVSKSSATAVSYAHPLQSVQTLHHTRAVLFDRVKLQNERKQGKQHVEILCQNEHRRT
jgi:hypothetical protein